VRTVTGGDVTGTLSCCYNLSHADSRVRIYRQKGERFAPVCVRQHDRLGGQKTRLIIIHGNLNAQRYINEVFNAEAIPFMLRNGPVVFQQDNARPDMALA
jgi:hypothetical protein